MKRRRGERLGRLAYVARIPPRRGQQPPTTIASAGAIGLPRDASALPTIRKKTSIKSYNFWFWFWFWLLSSIL